MESYIGTKRINAKPMNRLDYNKLRGWELPSNEDGADEGYLVEYVDGGVANTPEYDGYISWSPKDVFQKSYKLTTGMSFGEAIEALKLGLKVARSGWNGKAMFLWIKPATMIEESWIKDPMLLDICKANGGRIEALGTICMKTADNKVLTGWLASQTDMLSEDWTVLSE